MVMCVASAYLQTTFQLRGFNLGLHRRWDNTNSPLTICQPCFMLLQCHAIFAVTAELWRSWLARFFDMEKVGGSSPPSSTNGCSMCCKRPTMLFPHINLL